MRRTVANFVACGLAMCLLAVCVANTQAQGSKKLDKETIALKAELAKVAKGKGSEEDFEKLVKMSDELIENSKAFNESQYLAISEVTLYLFQQEDFDHAAHLCEALITAAKDIRGTTGKQLVERAEASLELVKKTKANKEIIGSPMEIVGTTVSGQDFNVEQYKGKYVLVDFWATWCGPCIAELPNVKENYEKYHGKGLEIVGVSLDSANSREAVAKFAAENGIGWVNLFSADPDATGWKHPMATKFGINAIPATFLLDQDGKVIAKNLRGKALGEKLAELFASGSE